MKKRFYYVMPFIIVPSLMLFLALLDSIALIKMNPYIIGTFLLLSSSLFGFLSPTNKNVDYRITIIMPLSVFCLLFVVGFLSETDLGTRFYLSQAVKVAIQPIALLIYLAMSIVTFMTSLKFVRKLRIHTTK